MKNYIQSPLPFQGQKRKFLRDFKEALKTVETSLIIDLFGGSGLLSHTAKVVKPEARVVYNDFDGYVSRIKNINRTNNLLAKIRPLLVNEPKDKRVKESIKAEILDIIAKEKGFVDYVTLSASLLFSGKYATNFEQLKKDSFYNVCIQKQYDATDYLQGVEVVSLDYKVLFEQYRKEPGVLFLIDPPYLSTDVSTYTGYWKLRDYLDVLKTLDGTMFFYFTSSKSSIVELCEWMSTQTTNANPFAAAIRTDIKTSINYNSTYTDIMYFRK